MTRTADNAPAACHIHGASSQEGFCAVDLKDELEVGVDERGGRAREKDRQGLHNEQRGRVIQGFGAEVRVRVVPQPLAQRMRGAARPRGVPRARRGRLGQRQHSGSAPLRNGFAVGVDLPVAQDVLPSEVPEAGEDERSRDVTLVGHAVSVLPRDGPARQQEHGRGQVRQESHSEEGSARQRSSRGPS